MLELAILGLLNEAPMHGYELRKQLGVRLGGFRVFSYGSLYPALRRLTRAGLIAEDTDQPVPETTSGAWSRRSRRVYRITAEGKERFADLLSDGSRQTWDDESFGVHLAFFSRTPAETRMRILEGRRRAVEERREGLRSALARAGEQIDRYTRELHQLGLDSTEREVRWLNELITRERAEQGEHENTPASAPEPHEKP
ncbi:PadR family transcriptional regulator [Pseudonocardia asaccharolytica]|uniref:PadR family transcriptional regulator n=1 Tax=Pseudonocardia asaccharolytica DSM 44247 = NBRC 16224 TaxID=1123024 RepID=A0A511D4I6_9PSEU|nr:PadR family transcriptional regulator [Pseudonocardia asaccharolytica]GEL19383.1 PadR family transcriptional regulator [Pseudonocardia asaccharolytica DSM 44247 = NBRC 16224]